MAIQVDFDGITATIDQGKWSTDKATDREGMMEEALNSVLKMDLTLKKYGTVEARDVDYHSALSMAKEFGGKITDLSNHESITYDIPGVDVKY